ncbi:MAG: septum site-determining protein MinC [Defluviitaleaceae bacterium]|nr:septum site-determining protein MinC [Defluviitaleaceae bacterium]
MNKDNTVIFKGGKNGIIMIMDKVANFETIKEVLTAKIRDAHKFFGDAKTSISFKGKKLNEDQIIELINIIISETDLTINFVEDLTGNANFEMVREAKPPPKPEKYPEPEHSVYNHLSEKSYTETTRFQRGSLRAGQFIHHNGSVVLLGDINAGAQIIASGNIVVFGAIKGTAFAGSTGDTSCIVSALTMQPIQLRIANEITYFTPEMIKENQNKINPSYAFIMDDEICIAAIE